eukprot:129766-Chlamydomonas_euryale.AAC.1
MHACCVHSVAPRMHAQLAAHAGSWGSHGFWEVCVLIVCARQEVYIGMTWRTRRQERYIEILMRLTWTIRCQKMEMNIPWEGCLYA